LDLKHSTTKPAVPLCMLQRTIESASAVLKGCCQGPDAAHLYDRGSALSDTLQLYLLTAPLWLVPQLVAAGSLSHRQINAYPFIMSAHTDATVLPQEITQPGVMQYTQYF